jgi:hypothetical protein
VGLEIYIRIPKKIFFSDIRYQVSYLTFIKYHAARKIIPTQRGCEDLMEF